MSLILMWSEKGQGSPWRRRGLAGPAGIYQAWVVRERHLGGGNCLGKGLAAPKS